MASTGRRIILVLWIVVTFSIASLGQGSSTLSGLVADSGGLPIVGAKVEATSNATGVVHTVETNESGRYSFANVPPGNYQVVVSKEGFGRITKRDVTVHVAQTLPLDFALQVGTVEETMTVEGSDPLVSTTSSSLGGLVESHQLTELPLPGRNYIGLTLMQPGIINVPNMNRAAGGTAGTWFSANGASQRSNNFLLDGAILQTFNGGATATLSGTTLGLEGIAEYRVITNAFPAEYGLTAGSQTVMVSKSGTNRFHGSLFEYLRNDLLDAANYFDTPAANGGRRLPPFRRNNFGGSLGGPIIKDKTFFFATYEALKERKGLTIVTNTLAPGCKAAANATVTNVACPQLGATASVTVNPLIAPIIALYPNPNLPNNQLTFPFSQPTEVRYGQARLDHNFSAENRIFGRYTIDDATTNGAMPFPQFTAPLLSRNQYLTIGGDHIFTPQVVNAWRLSASRTTAARQNPTDLIGPDYSFMPNEIIPQFSVTGLTIFGPVRGATYVNQTILTLTDDISMARGNHSFKFGTQINRFRWDMSTLSNVPGQLNFGSVANFIRGLASSYTAVTAQNVGKWRTYDFYTLGFYAQDSWRIRQNLTLNLGLRYEPRTELNEAHGIESVLLNPATDASYVVGELFKNPTKKNFSPRLGFNWDVFSDGKTSLRGGAALMYDVANVATALITQVNERPPFSGTSNLAGTPTVAVTKPLNFPASALNRSGNGTWEYNLKQPRLYMWNLGVEQQLPFSTAILVTYAGSRGMHLYSTYEGNPRVPTSFGPTGLPIWANASGPLTNPNWGFIPVIGSRGDSNYHSLQSSVRKRMSHGLTFQGSFTWAKTIDNTQSQATGDSITAPSYPGNPFDFSYDRGLSALHISKTFVLNALYNLPSPKTGNGFVNGVFGGWSVSGIFSAQDGIPFTPNVGTNRSNSGVNGGSPGNSGGIDRPDVNPSFTGPLYLGRVDRWFDPNAFALQAAGTLGNARRNSLIGPGLQNVDFSLLKDTKLAFLGEAGRIEFRAEAFNLLNHPNFAVPNNVVFSTTATPLATAGQIIRTQTDSRQMQFGLRIAF